MLCGQNEWCLHVQDTVHDENTDSTLFSLLFPLFAPIPVLKFCHTSPIVRKFTLLCYFKQRKNIIQLMCHKSIKENDFIYFLISIKP